MQIVTFFLKLVLSVYYMYVMFHVSTGFYVVYLFFCTALWACFKVLYK